MDEILQGGVNLILWIQQFSPMLDWPFKVLTFLGSEIFFLLFLPLVIWSIDYKIGIRFTVLFLFSAYLNALAKIMAGQPRPFEFDTRVQKLVKASGGGLPSGHTQNSVVVWGYLAASFRKRWFWWLAGLLMVFIPLSRVYLGVHFPSDLLGGYILGIIILLLFVRLEPPLTDWLKTIGLARQIGLSVVIPLLLIIFFPGHENSGVTAAATMLGGSLGLVLDSKLQGFKATGTWWQRLLRYWLGMTILAVIYLGLKFVFSGLEPEPFFRTIRYGLVGFFTTFGGPWLFLRLKLASKA